MEEVILSNNNDSSSQYIRIGDNILLMSEEEQEDGFLSAGGISGDQCVVRVEKSRESLFKIVPLAQYTSKQELKDRLKRKKWNQGMTMGTMTLKATDANNNVESEKDEEIAHLGEYVKMEESVNSMIASQLEGKYLLYGMIIQLLHVTTSKYVKAEDKEVKLDKGSKFSWFRVTPHNKTRVDGEKVSVKDQIRFVHVKTDRFIYQTPTLIDDTYEVTLDSRGTAWTLLLESGVASIKQDTLRANDCIRIFHKEGGYLRATKENRVLFRSLQSWYDVSNSYLNMWQIEEEMPTDTGEIFWNQPWRLKLLGTDLYLSTVITEDAEDKGSAQLVLTSDKSNKNTLFALVAAQSEKGDAVTFTTVYVQTYGPRPKFMFCVTQDVLVTTTEMGGKESEVFFTTNSEQKSSISLKRVPKEQLDTHDYVVSRAHTINSFLELPRGPTDEIEKVLDELICFCTNSQVENPLEGTPIQVNQKLIATKLLESIVGLLVCSFQLENFKLSKLVYRLVKQVCKGNHKCAIMFNEYAEILSHPPPTIWMDAIPTLIEIYRDNRVLLENLSPKLVDGIEYCKSTMKKDKKPLFLQLLSILCLCENVPVPANQKIICHMLEQSADLIVNTRVNTKKNKVEIYVKEEWISLKKFIFGKDRELVDYYEKLLLLFANICAGRNYMGIKLVERWVGFKHAFLCVKNDAFDNAIRFRSAYSRILLSVFVDCYPQKNFVRLNYAWPLDKASRLLGGNKGGNIRYEPEKDPTSIDLKNTSNLHEFMHGFICVKEHFGWEPNGKRTNSWEFFLDMLRLLRVSFAFGWFKRDEQYLLPRLREILQVEPQLTTSGKGTEGSVLSSKESSLLMQIKYETCLVLDLYLDLKLKYAFEEFIHKHLTQDDITNQDKIKDGMIEEVQKLTILDVNDNWNLSPVLLRLLKHENNKLSSISLHLLVRLQRSQKAEILNAISQIQFLTKAKDLKNHEIVVQYLEVLRKLTASHMSQAEQNEVLRILKEFTNMCYENDGTMNHLAQHIFFSYHVHEEIIGILKLPLEQDQSDYQCISAIFEQCHNFLQAFCRNNSNNQSVLFNYVGFLIDQRIRYPIIKNIIDTLNEVFKNNHQLCAKLVHQENIFRYFRRLVDQRDPSHLVFLKTIVAPDEYEIKANQNAILELIMTAKHAPLAQLSDGKRKKSSMDDQYHFQLITLVALCGSRNQEARNICQKILSYDECLDIMHKNKDNPMLEAAYANFFDVVYLRVTENYQKSVALYANNEKIWQFIDQLSSKFELFYIRFADNMGVKASQRDSFYISALVTFLENFYSKYFNSEKSSMSFVNTSNKILDFLASIAEYYMEVNGDMGEFPISEVTQCLSTMRQAEIKGFNFFDKIDILLSDLKVEVSKLENKQSETFVSTESHENKIKPAINKLLKTCYKNIAEFLATDDHDEPSYLKVMVFQLRNTLYQDDFLKLSCLKILLNLLKKSSDLATLQNKLTDLETPLAALWLLGVKDQVIVEAALDLVIALLDDGSDPSNPKANPKVQESILETFISRPDETFFRNVHYLIQKSKSQIKDRKRNINQVLPSAPMKEDKKDNGSIRNKSSFMNTVKIEKSTSSKKRGKRFTMEDEDDNIAMNRLTGGGEEDYQFKSSELSRSKNDYPILLRVFRLLQFMSKSNTNNIFKNYCRIQADNYESFDLVKELIQFLKVFEGLIGSAGTNNFGLVFQLFACLNELILSEPENQMAVINDQVITPINKILANDFNGSQKILVVKIKILEFLLNLVAKPQTRIISKMTSTLNFESLADNTSVLQTENPSEEAIQLASLSYRLIKILSENETSQNQRLHTQLDIVENNCRAIIGRIEIITDDNRLERVYFPIPKYFRDKDEEHRATQDRARQKRLDDQLVLWGTDWKKTTDKIENFCKWSEYYLVEAEDRIQLERTRIRWFLASKSKWWSYLCFLLSWAINITILASADSSGVMSPGASVVKALGIVLTIFSALNFSSFVLNQGTVIKYKGLLKRVSRERSFMLKDTSERKEGIKDYLHNDSQRKRHKNFSFVYSFGNSYYVINTKTFLSHSLFVYNALHVVTAVLGLAVHPYFFCFHLLQIVSISEQLKTVLRAMGISLKVLGALGIFILVGIYIFAIIALVAFPGHFDPQTGSYCDTLIQCSTSLIYWGILSGNQLVQFLVPMNWPDHSDTAGWVIYMVVYYVVFGIFLLNVTLAVIVDTFGELRDAKSESEFSKANSCFICSVDRETFKRKGVDFNGHTQSDHNLWHYLYFFAYLKEQKMKGDLTPIEQYLMNKIEHREFTKFFPIERAYALEFEENIDDLNTRILSKIAELENSAFNVSDLQERNIRENKELRGAITNLMEEVAFLRKNQLGKK